VRKISLAFSNSSCPDKASLGIRKKTFVIKIKVEKTGRFIITAEFAPGPAFGTIGRLNKKMLGRDGHFKVILEGFAFPVDQSGQPNPIGPHH